MLYFAYGLEFMIRLKANRMISHGVIDGLNSLLNR